MNIKNIKKNLSIIILNYNQIIKKSFYFIISMILVVGSSLIITLPLWYLATKHSKVYTITVIFLFLITFGFLIVLNFKKWIISKKEKDLNTSSIILIPVKKAFTFLLFAAGLYVIIIVYTLELLFAGVLLTAGYLITLGYFLFISKMKNESH